MPEYYYTHTPNSEHEERHFTSVFMGKTLAFETDAGVFSKQHIDPGSEILCKSLPELHGRVLDMGCGWGAIGVLLARLCPDAQITMADINERAVALAARNARQNGVSAETLVSDGYENIAPSFDAIVTNPPIRAGKQTVYRILDEAKTRLAPGGRLFLVIRKEQGAPSAQTHLQGVYSRVELLARKKGYWILACE